MTAPAPEGNAPATDVVDPAVPASTPDAPKAGERTPEEEVAHWKAMARKNEDAAKANKKAADELAQIKASQMSEAEKAAAERKALEVRAQELETQNVRYKAAALHGISEENFDLLGTGTEEEVLARAERLGEMEDAVLELAQLKAAQAAASTAANTPGPVPALRPGTSSTEDTEYPAGWFPSLTPRTTSLTS